MVNAKNLLTKISVFFNFFVSIVKPTAIIINNINTKEWLLANYFRSWIASKCGWLCRRFDLSECGESAALIDTMQCQLFRERDREGERSPLMARGSATVCTH